MEKIIEKMKGGKAYINVEVFTPGIFPKILFWI